MDQLASKFLAKYKENFLNKLKNTNNSTVLNSFKATPGNDLNFINQIIQLKNEHCYIYYNNDHLQSLILETLNLALIYDNIDKENSKQSQEKSPEDIDHEEILVKELLRYFKDDFFKWTNQPDCSSCGKNDNQQYVSGERPNQEEFLRDPKCGYVEVYKCNSCGATTRFPRFNSPAVLLQTRQGRCGEWAALFTYILVSFQLRTRYIWNKEDHVWCEYFNTKQQRWIHLDSCEKAYDEPHIYARNWNKKMSYVLGFSDTGITDLSKKYVDNVNKDNVIKRTLMKSDEEMYKLLTCLNNDIRSSFPPDQQFTLHQEDEKEYLKLNYPNGTPKKIDDSNTKGRQSGSAEWVNGRGEGGQ
mgnify:FL=1